MQKKFQFEEHQEKITTEKLLNTITNPKLKDDCDMWCPHCRIYLLNVALHKCDQRII